MAGYIINLDNIESLKLYINNGVYATKLSSPQGHWKIHHEATFGDYSTMQPGDNIYFFIDRKIYGIGELVQVMNDCKYLNFPQACEPREFDYSGVKNSLIWDEGDFSSNQRWICLFKPSPYFFSRGIDMDDVLSSNPFLFRMLRVFWKVSFIKFDNEESQAFKNIILKHNQEALSNPEHESIFKSEYKSIHEKIKDIVANNQYRFDICKILANCSDGNRLRHEMAIESGILFQLAINDQDTVSVFGKWDYLSHQVAASPFKPVDYIDKMDLFGYRYIEHFKPTIAEYLVGEIKKGGAKSEDIEQLLKYVDWVKDEYCFNDYSPINAFLIAADFPGDVIAHRNENAKRYYTIGRRPAKTLLWNNLKLIKYIYGDVTNRIRFELINR